MLKMYEFTLKFYLPDVRDDPNTYIGQLAKAGCEDALIGIGKTGRLALNFSRESSSAFEAISSAISDVKQAIPDTKLAEATPDLVGLTDVAEILQCSRQNIRKIMLKGGMNFPAPVHEGKSSLWHLSKVLAWLQENKPYNLDDSLLDIAAINMQLNMARGIDELDMNIRGELLTLVS